MLEATKLKFVDINLLHVQNMHTIIKHGLVNQPGNRRSLMNLVQWKMNTETFCYIS